MNVANLSCNTIGHFIERLFETPARTVLTVMSVAYAAFSFYSSLNSSVRQANALHAKRVNAFHAQIVIDPNFHRSLHALHSLNSLRGRGYLNGHFNHSAFKARIREDFGSELATDSIILNRQYSPNMGPWYNFSGHEFTRLPEFREFSQMKGLIVDNNFIRELPTFQFSPQIEYVHANHNLLETLPDNLNPSLIEIRVSHNRIRLVPNLSHLENLTTLDLSNNLLTDLNEQICNIPNLRRLNISNNHILELPNNLNPLLSEIRASHNRIRLVPNLSHLQNLTTLEISSNLLTSLPENIQDLRNLIILDVRNNRLTKLPDFLTRLRSDCVIYADFNHFSEPEIEQFIRLRNQQRQADPTLGPDLDLGAWHSISIQEA